MLLLSRRFLYGEYNSLLNNYIIRLLFLHFNFFNIYFIFLINKRGILFSININYKLIRANIKRY